MRNFINIFIGCLFFAVGTAQSLEQKAFDMYENANYPKAQKLFVELSHQQPENEMYHYNLGNIYFKQGKIGESIWHYEKAIKINPDFQSAKTNLSFANQLKKDNFSGMLPVSKQLLFYENLSVLTLTQWAVISLSFSGLSLFFFLVYYFIEKPLLKKIFLGSTIFSVLFALVSYYILGQQRSYLEYLEYAVIMKKEVEMKKAPRTTAESMMTIHEGTKFYIEEETDVWYRARLSNDSVGFVKKEFCKPI